MKYVMVGCVSIAFGVISALCGFMVPLNVYSSTQQELCNQESNKLVAIYTQHQEMLSACDKYVNVYDREVCTNSAINFLHLNILATFNKDLHKDHFNDKAIKKCLKQEYIT